ncbi:type I restriction endonuclease subunit M [Aeromonas salmonicida subsp. achromogenes]|uniref:N-6 DNA methylase n=1 Tax=Aeromonas salmonicida TaxID=645 RepID=UPI000302D244|nr:N-6 DNA methylase [Aeromonas salmonicida]TMX11620.1 type I restriction endonuclease subunit M [Aeromonas salmonicida subsp. achromogenes]TMX14931.1 type I restriction endonuclease subunit M [Aeromonas salmonicida subsp. achromogenes]TMX15166.1 type I restriction endonuclease subunit M [Aeromonas salmonicida subsp. achromogenes]TMX20213.1 type I restriction endonuclease subunit M [Aeromonas salmonicida subsp. achromogenes]
MDNLTKPLWALMDYSRGVMEASHTLELIGYIAFVAKENPETFQAIVNSGHAKQLNMLIEAGQALKATHPADVCAAPNHYRIDAKMLNQVVSFIAEITNFGELASALRDLSAQTIGKFDVSSANQNMENVFSALIGDCSEKTVYDGACGLARVASSLTPKALYLEEMNHSSYLSAYRLLTLENRHFNLANTDSLLEPAFGQEQTFDVVVMEPPMAQKFSADERRMLVEAPFITVPVGKAVSANSGDSLWIQQAISHLNETGKAYILLPQGILFRGGYDANVREYLLENELLEAVIGLPAAILDGTSIPPVILVLNKNKQAGSPVVFVDASDMGSEDKHRVTISHQEAKRIADLAAGKRIDERYKAVLIPEIRQNNNGLSISRYIVKEIEVEELDLAKELKILQSYQADFEQSQQVLTSLLAKYQ